MEEQLDLRIRKTYLALHNAFVSLLAEKRFEDLTVNELCDRAMIRRTTFYKHFADKYEYFAFYLKEVVAEFQKQLDPDVPEYKPAAYLLHMSRELFRFMNRHEQMVSNMENSSMAPILLSILLDQISRDLSPILHRAGRSASEDPDGIAAFYAGGILSTLFQYRRGGAAVDEEQFLSVIRRFIRD